MSLTDYITSYEATQMQGRNLAVEARARVMSADKILGNVLEMWKYSDEELKARNIYENGHGHLWLEENDWVYGMLTKAIRYARGNLPQTAEKIYYKVHVLQGEIRMRKMGEKEYLELKSKSVKALVDELSG